MMLKFAYDPTRQGELEAYCRRCSDDDLRKLKLLFERAAHDDEIKARLSNTFTRNSPGVFAPGAFDKIAQATLAAIIDELNRR